MNRKLKYALLNKNKLLTEDQCGVAIKELFSIMTKALHSQKMKVLLWIIDNMDKNNRLPYTQHLIAKNVNVSVATVNALFRDLAKQDLIKKNKGIYFINPALIGVFGDYKKNKEILIQYKSINSKNE